MFQVLQWLGGGFYLLNKIFLSLSERAKSNKMARAQRWRVISWLVYLAGLPAWVIIFIHKHDWIAASLEAGGGPAMLLGLVTAIRGTADHPPRWLNRIALLCIPVGLGYSLYDFGGLTAISQWLEIALVLGFLVGTYLLARERMSGYLWYVLMHVSCGWLMYRQGYPWLAMQQAASLVFIVDAYVVSRKHRHLGSSHQRS